MGVTLREGTRVGMRRRVGVAGRGREGVAGRGREGGRGGDRGREVRVELEVFEDRISQEVLDKIGDEEEREIDSEKEE